MSYLVYISKTNYEKKSILAKPIKDSTGIFFLIFTLLNHRQEDPNSSTKWHNHLLLHIPLPYRDVSVIHQNIILFIVVHVNLTFSHTQFIVCKLVLVMNIANLMLRKVGGGTVV